MVANRDVFRMFHKFCYWSNEITFELIKIQCFKSVNLLYMLDFGFGNDDKGTLTKLHR